MPALNVLGISHQTCIVSTPIFKPGHIIKQGLFFTSTYYDLKVSTEQTACCIIRITYVLHLCFTQMITNCSQIKMET